MIPTRDIFYNTNGFKSFYGKTTLLKKVWQKYTFKKSASASATDVAKIHF
jgi:hypothetical protein